MSLHPAPMSTGDLMTRTPADESSLLPGSVRQAEDVLDDAAMAQVRAVRHLGLLRQLGAEPDLIIAQQARVDQAEQHCLVARDRWLEATAQVQHYEIYERPYLHNPEVYEARAR